MASVAPDRTGQRLRISWDHAQDDRTPVDRIRYHVYASSIAGRATARGPVLVTEPGVTSVMLEVAPVGVAHHVVVRAVDEDGREDGNTIEKSAVATPDTTPPSFTGAKEVAGVPHAGVTISWDPASDDLTPPEGIRYAVYDPVGGAPLGEVEGKTSITLTDLGVSGERRRFVVRARDAAENSDGNERIVEGVLGGDTKPPIFGGCTGALALGSKVVEVSWAEATDEGGPSSGITYEVFAAQSPGAQNFAAPNATVRGGTKALVRDLAPSTTHYFVCRAKDAAGNGETNTIETSARTTGDVAPPTFGGATADPLVPATARETTLRWTPATDSKTPPEKIVYVVYEARGDGTPFDFTTPRAVSAPNATSITLSDLPSRTKLRWIVRARDEDWNEDPNVVESTVTTLTSFARDIQPFLAQNCAVVGCHVTPVSAGGLSMSPPVAYANLLRTASQRPPDWEAGANIQRIEPGNLDGSYLWRKIEGVPGTILGSPMPAPATGNSLTPEQKDLVRSWILEGAPNN